MSKCPFEEVKDLIASLNELSDTITGTDEELFDKGDLNILILECSSLIDICEDKIKRIEESEE